MPLDRKLFRRLNEADRAEHVALLRVLCESLLETEPAHGPTLIRYARCLIEFSRYDEAREALDRAECVVPQDKRHFVFAMRGHRLEHMGDFAGAEREHLRAHELDPDDATYLIYAGSVAFRRGDPARAEALARQAVTCSEGCLDEAYFNLGGYLLAQRRYLEARDCYKEALKVDPDYSIAKKRLEDVEEVIRKVNDPPAAPIL